MAKLPVLSWKDIEKVYLKLGYRYVKQKGSHRSYVRDDLPDLHLAKIVQIIVQKEVRDGTLRFAISKVGLTREEFLKLLNEK
jgi:predicted RNA binding protein YcfA (HicA-like mRNA interferase family)